MSFCFSNQQLPMHKLEPSMITDTTGKQPNLEMFAKQRKYSQGLKKTNFLPCELTKQATTQRKSVWLYGLIFYTALVFKIQSYFRVQLICVLNTLISHHSVFAGLSFNLLC